MKTQYDNSYPRFILDQSARHREALLALPFSAEAAEKYATMADSSLREQRIQEEADTLPFESYRQLYLAPFRLSE
jgi:glutamate--cysteine ligase